MREQMLNLELILAIVALLAILTAVFFAFLWRKSRAEGAENAAIASSVGKHNEDRLREQLKFSDSLIKTAQIIILVLDVKGRIELINPYMEELTGYTLSEIAGKDWFSTFLPEEDHAKIKKLFQNAVGNIQTKGNVNSIIAKDGRKIFVEWNDKTLQDSHGNVKWLLAVGVNITKRKQVEDELRKNEERLTLALNGANDGLWDWNLETNAAFFSPRWKNMLGYEDSEIIDHPDSWEALIHPDDLMRTKETLNLYLEGKLDKYELEFRLRHKHGHYLNIFSRGNAIKNQQGKPVRFAGTHVDITKLKQVEAALRESEISAINSEKHVRLLLTNLEYVREEEQKRIAGEIHDELGSLITKHLMDISWMQEHPPKNQKELDEKLLEMSKFLVHILGAVRSVASSLRPRILDECGLTAALEGLVFDINQQEKISCSWLEAPVEIELDELHRTIFFRICQEAFTNIVRHSGAKKVNISFRLENSMVVLEVLDDGCGIDFNEVKNQDSFGIHGMKERALKIGGKFGLEMRPEGGTRLWVHVPLQEIEGKQIT
ncbi:MAG: PAS domain S-box protein [Magnetococcales bacterium]|nr:PAS domain S-box protein [Magnetococcales bacterium]